MASAKDAELFIENMTGVAGGAQSVISTMSPMIGSRCKGFASNAASAD